MIATVLLDGLTMTENVHSAEMAVWNVKPSFSFFFLFFFFFKDGEGIG
jgi:hypothetical protein